MRKINEQLYVLEVSNRTHLKYQKFVLFNLTIMFLNETEILFLEDEKTSHKKPTD